jgi:hypothetical protein
MTFRRVIQSCTVSKGPLLTRYHLLKTRWFGLYLHHLHISDDERALHDHPWSFTTVLLSGGYYEWTPTNQETKQLGELRLVGARVFRRTWYPRFSILYRPAEWAHRLELTGPVWTLVLRFRVRRRWGFFLPDGWIHWWDYTQAFCDEETES